MSNIIIRRFISKDRSKVRRICCDTADKGEPIEDFFQDRAVAADVLSSYYTDYEPEAVFVAEDGGQVIGYICGALDNRRYGLVMFWILFPKVLINAFMRGILFQKYFWTFVQGMMKNGKRLFIWRKESFHSHQGHMHIGIVKNYRGKHIGQKLVAALLDHARELGIDEMTASVHDGNAGACHFFGRLGFKIKDRYPMVMAYKGQETAYHSLLYVKKILSVLFFFVLMTSAANAKQGMEGVDLNADDRILVLAPHPDDEVLGAGGVILKATAMNLPVKIVFLTYGDSNQWSFMLYRKHPVIMPGAIVKMGLIRHDEAISAASILGVNREQLTFLGYPDFGTMNIWYSHWDDRPPLVGMLTRASRVPYQGAMRPGALFNGDDILQDLRKVIREFKPTKIFVSHPSDHNGDHLSLYLFTRIALWDEKLEKKVELYPYLVHFLGWPKPAGFHPDRKLVPPESLKNVIHWKENKLSPKEFDLKKAALQAHKSQYGSTPKYLLSFIKTNEIFGDFPSIHLKSNEDVRVFETRKAFVPTAELPDELNNREKLAFVGVEWKFVRWEKDDLVISIELSKPLAKNVEASVYIFGYNKMVPFERMPKISVRLGVLSYTVYDQAVKIEQSSVRVKRTPNEVVITMPFKLLGNPDRILTSARTYLGNVPLDNASWISVELY